jgi:hypothetical protein
MTQPCRMPPSPEHQYIKLIAPALGHDLLIRPLVDECTGYYTHWDGSTKRCRHPNQCYYCNQHKPRRWTTCLPALQLPAGRKCVILLGRAATHRLEQLIGPGNSLKRYYVHLQRKGPRKNGPVLCTIEPAPTNGSELVCDIDVDACTRLVWGEADELFK